MNPDAAIRIEHNGKNREWVFLCDDGCGREIRRRKDRLDVSPGLCHVCGNKRLWSQKRRPFESLFNQLRARAKKAGKAFSLTFDEFLEFTEIPACEYCGRLVRWMPRKSYLGASYPCNLDRKDNSLGYSKHNCAVCCGECNRIKGSIYSYDQMKIIGGFLRRNQWFLK